MLESLPRLKRKKKYLYSKTAHAKKVMGCVFLFLINSQMRLINRLCAYFGPFARRVRQVARHFFTRTPGRTPFFPRTPCRTPGKTVVNKKWRNLGWGNGRRGIDWWRFQLSRCRSKRVIPILLVIKNVKIKISISGPKRAVFFSSASQLLRGRIFQCLWKLWN